MKCDSCGSDHELLDPAFRRPDAIHRLPKHLRAGNVIESDDLCALRARSDSETDHYFVRCTMDVSLLDRPGELTQWGLWAEIGGEDSARIRDLWTAPEQTGVTFSATLANDIPGYAPTIGLPMRLQLTGPKTRPSLVFTAQARHPFVDECRAGVRVHRLAEWLDGLRS